MIVCDFPFCPILIGGHKRPDLQHAIEVVLFSFYLTKNEKANNRWQSCLVKLNV